MGESQADVSESGLVNPVPDHCFHVFPIHFRCEENGEHRRDSFCLRVADIALGSDGMNRDWLRTQIRKDWSGIRRCISEMSRRHVSETTTRQQMREKKIK